MRFPPRSLPARRAFALALLTLAFGAGVAHAGQVRIDVNSNFFSPDAITVNVGDQVVWVWVAGLHSVTSGTVDAGGNEFPDGRFDTGTVSTSINSTFTFKTTATGSIPYYCIPHASFGMVADITVVASGAQTSSFRISEVRWTAAHDHDFIELVNLGLAGGDLGRYRVSVTGAAVQTLSLKNIVVPPNGRVVLMFNQSGVNNASTLYFPGIPLGPAGSAALYAPTTLAADAPLTNSKLLVDFVQWGAGGQQNEGTANTAGAWTTGSFVPAVAEGHSIDFCGTAADRGEAFWQGSAVPTPGLAGCTTPSLKSSWGRVKALYR